MTQHYSDDFLAESLSRLPREHLPPAALEDATVLHLRRAGVLRTKGTSPHRGFNIVTWALAASIATVAFVGGSVFANRNASSGPQPTFALLLYGAGSSDDSATNAARTAEYSQWASNVRGDAQIVGGEALGRSVAALAVRTVGRGGDSVVIADDSSGPNDFVGYFLVSAPNRDAAVRLARDCPHLKYGGRVVVRRIQNTDGALATLESGRGR